MARKNKKTIVNKYELGTDSSGVDFSKYISDPSLTEEDFANNLQKDGFSGEMLEKAMNMFKSKDYSGLEGLLKDKKIGGLGLGKMGGGMGAVGSVDQSTFAKAGGISGVAGAVTSGMATYQKEKDNKDVAVSAEVQGGLDTAAGIAGNISGTSLITKGTDIASDFIQKQGDDTDASTRAVSKAIKRGGQGAAIGTAIGGPIGGGIGAGIGIIEGVAEGITEQKNVDRSRKKERERIAQENLTALQIKEAEERQRALKAYWSSDKTKVENSSLNNPRGLKKGGVVGQVDPVDPVYDAEGNPIKKYTFEEKKKLLDQYFSSPEAGSFKDIASFMDSDLRQNKIIPLLENKEDYEYLREVLNRNKFLGEQWDVYTPSAGKGGNIDPNAGIRWAPVSQIQKMKAEELMLGGDSNEPTNGIEKDVRRAFRVNPENQKFEQLKVDPSGTERWVESNETMGGAYLKKGNVENANIYEEFIGGQLGKTVNPYLKDKTLPASKNTRKILENLEEYNLAVVKETFSEGGEIKGKGGPKDDKIPALLDKTGFVVPAENAHIAKAVRRKYLGDGGNKTANLESGNVPVKISNGEHYFTAEEHALLKMKGVDLDKLAPNAKSGKNLKDGGEPGDDTRKRIKILEDKLKEKNLSKEEWIKYNKALNTLKIKNYESQIPKALKELEATEAYNKHGSKAHKYREDLRENVKKSYEKAIDDIKKDNDSSIIKRYNENKTKSIKDSKSEYYRKPEKENIKSTEPSDSKILKSEYYRKPDDTPTVKPKSKTGSGVKSAVKQETTVVQEKPQLKDIPLEAEIIDEPEVEKLREQYAVEQAYKEYKNAPLLEREKKFNIERNDIIAATQLALGLAGANALPKEPKYMGSDGLKKLYNDAQGFTNELGEFDPVSYGLTPEEWAKHTSDINAMLKGNYQSIRDMAGGNTGVALANMLAANNNALRAKREVAAIDKSYKREEQKDNAMLRSQAQQRKLQGFGIQTQLAGAIADDEYRKYKEEQNKFDRNSAAFSDLIGSGLQNLFTSDEMRKMKERDIERKNKYGE